MPDIIKGIMRNLADDPEKLKRFQENMREAMRADTAEQIVDRSTHIAWCLKADIQREVRDATVSVLEAHLKKQRELKAKFEALTDRGEYGDDIWLTVLGERVANVERQLARFDDQARDDRKREKTRERVRHYRERVKAA